jgi:hypothetical protein
VSAAHLRGFEADGIKARKVFVALMLFAKNSVLLSGKYSAQD